MLHSDPLKTSRMGGDEGDSVALSVPRFMTTKGPMRILSPLGFDSYFMVPLGIGSDF